MHFTGTFSPVLATGIKSSCFGALSEATLIVNSIRSFLVSSIGSFLLSIIHLSFVITTVAAVSASSSGISIASTTMIRIPTTFHLPFSTTPLVRCNLVGCRLIQRSMNKTETPKLSEAVLGRLRDYAALFRDDFCRHDQARWTAIYLQGLLRDGERKSIEPLAGRVVLPAEWDIQDPTQALQNFVNQSPWREQLLWQRYRRHLAQTFASPAGLFVIDDVSCPKQGRHSVGVQRQYCGALGKKANCQVAVSLHYVSPRGHYPLA